MGQTHRGRGLLVIVAVVVLAGCAGFLPGDSTEREVPEELGEVDGVSYDDKLEIDPEEGFTEEELDEFVKRTMARIEVVRQLEFDRPVDVDLFTREEYRDWRANRSTSRTEAEWENQIWRSLFLIGQDTNATAELDEAFGGAVQGFYQPGQDQIVIVSDSESPTINKATLIHELVHALQEQQFGLEFGHESRDEQAAYDTVVEGEADLVPRLYLEEWCEQWSCLRPELATEGGTGGDATLDLGIYLMLTQPYTQGTQFVEGVKSEGGWEAVNELHENPPRSTAQTIYPERSTEFVPENISITDQSSGDWERFDHEPVGDTLGVASLYSMFAANDIVEIEEPIEYAHPVVEGWQGDRIVPYRSAGEFGYVWELSWESEDDAEQFAEAYRELLDSHGGLARGSTSYVIPDGPFAGAYRLTVEDDRVLIVNGPDLDSLTGIHER